MVILKLGKRSSFSQSPWQFSKHCASNMTAMHIKQLNNFVIPDKDIEFTSRDIPWFLKIHSKYHCLWRNCVEGTFVRNMIDRWIVKPWYLFYRRELLSTRGRIRSNLYSDKMECIALRYLWKWIYLTYNHYRMLFWKHCFILLLVLSTWTSQSVADDDKGWLYENKFDNYMCNNNITQLY